MNTTLQTQATQNTQITLPTGRVVMNKTGKVMRTEISFLPQGVKSASNLRKYFRDEEGMTNAQAREAANAALSGQQGKVQELMAAAFLQDSLSNGFMPTTGAENVKGDKRTLTFERKDIGAQVKDAAAKAKAAVNQAKAEMIANAKASLEAQGVAPEVIEATLAALSA